MATVNLVTGRNW